MQKTSEIYKNLYHYTTWEGLKGILKAQSLWATNYKFLKDYSEIVLFREKLVSLIFPTVLEGYKQLIAHKPSLKGKIQKDGGLKRIVQHDAEVLIEVHPERAYFRLKKVDIHVFQKAPHQLERHIGCPQACCITDFVFTATSMFAPFLRKAPLFSGLLETCTISGARSVTVAT